MIAPAPAPAALSVDAVEDAVTPPRMVLMATAPPPANDWVEPFVDALMLTAAEAEVAVMAACCSAVMAMLPS